MLHLCLPPPTSLWSSTRWLQGGTDATCKETISNADSLNWNAGGCGWIGIQKFHYLFSILLFTLQSRSTLPIHTMTNKRFSFVNFPIPFDHPYILPTLFTTMTVSAVAYYALQASHHKDLVEALRKQHMRKRRHLHHPEDRYASLQVMSAQGQCTFRSSINITRTACDTRGWHQTSFFACT